MNIAPLLQTLTIHDIEVDTESVAELGPNAWRAQTASGQVVIRFVGQEYLRASRAINTMLEQPTSRFDLLQPMRKCFPCEGGVVAVFDWISGTTLRQTRRRELPLFFTRLAHWHSSNKGVLPMYSRYTGEEHVSLDDLLTAELLIHLDFLCLADLGKACRDMLWPLATGFPTYIHGDVHPGNVVRQPGGEYILVDPEYLHVGCNYFDLDYVDWWSVEADPAPCLNVGLRGVEPSVTEYPLKISDAHSFAHHVGRS